MSAKNFSLLLLFLLPISLLGQNIKKDSLENTKYTIKGIVIDSSDNLPIEMAIAALYKESSGSLITGMATDKQGEFTLNNIQAGSYTLLTTFIGYDTVQIPISTNLFKENTIQIDTILLQVRDIRLSEVTITAESPELVIKEDTLEYSAAAFKVAEGAVVEDLLKRLPGMEVDTDGNIKKPDGKQVRRVYVDGKEFFGDDPKMATKNLTADIIDKVQVIEKKSDMAILTGIDDDNEETIINITIKKGMKQGWMGNVTSGLGALTQSNTDNDIRYTENLMINRFLENDQITFIANANNINNQGSNDRGNSARSGRSRSGRDGITSSNTFGINIAKIINDKIKFGGNIRYNYSDSYREEDRFRQNILKDSVSYRKTLSKDRDYSNNFAFDGRLEYQMDSSTMIVVSPSISYNYSKSNSTSFQSTMAGDADSSKVNESNSTDWLKSDGINTSLRLNASRKLSSNGRRISMGASFSLNNSSGTGKNNSENIFFQSSNRNRFFDQKSQSNNNRSSYGLSIGYVEPVYNNNFLDLSYDIDVNNTKNRKETYDYDKNTDDFTTIDPEYNKSSDTRNINHNIRANFRSVRTNYTYNIGLMVRPTIRNSKSFIKDWYSVGNDSIVNELPDRTTTNYAPRLDFTYRFSNTRELRKNLRIRYNGSTTQPTVNQLDPTVNNTNPLRIRSGNPDLVPAFNHNISLNYDFNNRETQKIFTVNLTHAFTQNKIINYTTYEKNTGVEYTNPINENGSWETRGVISFSKPLNKNKKLKFSSRANLNYQNEIGYSLVEKETLKNISKTINAGGEINLSYSNDFFYGQLRNRLNYSKTANTIASGKEMEYFRYGIEFNTTLTLPYSWSLTSDITYSANSGLSEGYNLNELIWNAKINKSILKHNRGLIGLQINDILQRKLSIRRNVAANYIEDIRSNAMTGYFMVSFSYRFNNIGGKGRSRSRGENRPNFDSGGQDIPREDFRGRGPQF